jgi:hypothetical protein
MKKKNIKVLFLATALLVTALLLVGCSDCCDRCECDDGFEFNLFSFNGKVQGSGVIVQEQRGVDGFTEVVLSEKGDLFIEFGDHEELVIEAEDNFQDYLIASVENGVLEILKSPQNITLVTGYPINYYLTLTSLESITVKNSGDVEITEIQGESFSVRVTGSGSVFIENLNVEYLDVELTSSGGLVIEEGWVSSQDIYLSSSGEYAGSAVESIHTTVRCSSSGNANVNVTNSLEADLSSSGSVYYIGDPTIEILDVSSTGKVVKAP